MVPGITRTAAIDVGGRVRFCCATDDAQRLTLRNLGHDPERSSAAAGDLHRQREDPGARRRYRIQRRDVLDDRYPGSGEDPIRLAREVRSDIGLWLTNHIKRDDKHYVNYVKRDLEGSFVARMLNKIFG